MCFEYEIITDELTRQVQRMQVGSTAYLPLDLPRSQYNINQWGKGEDALCHGCRELLCKKCIESIGTTEKIQHQQVCFCSHCLERCEICMVDYTLLNNARKSHRDLTDDERYPHQQQDLHHGWTIRVSKERAQAALSLQ